MLARLHVEPHFKDFPHTDQMGLYFPVRIRATGDGGELKWRRRVYLSVCLLEFGGFLKIQLHQEKKRGLNIARVFRRRKSGRCQNMCSA